MTREEIAREALTTIAAPGLVRKDYGACPVCKHEQPCSGVCLNRACPAVIARTALEAMRAAQ